MKNKNPLQVLFASALLLACLFQSVSLMAQGQQGGPPCTSCSCGGGFFAGPCASGQCCNGTTAVCDCYVWWNKCACTNGAVGMLPSFEPQHESNILGMVNYLQNGGFTSPQSGVLVSQLPLLIKAQKSNDAALYEQTGRNLESTSRQLPANEKQLINNWIAARSGTVRIE